MVIIITSEGGRGEGVVGGGGAVGVLLARYNKSTTTNFESYRNNERDFTVTKLLANALVHS